LFILILVFFILTLAAILIEYFRMESLYQQVEYVLQRGVNDSVEYAMLDEYRRDGYSRMDSALAEETLYEYLHESMGLNSELDKSGAAAKEKSTMWNLTWSCRKVKPNKRKRNWPKKKLPWAWSSPSRTGTMLLTVLTRKPEQSACGTSAFSAARASQFSAAKASSLYAAFWNNRKKQYGEKHRVAKTIKTILPPIYTVSDEPPKCGKDVNDYLKITLKIRQPRERE
jgi:hypothetical protein